MTTVQELTAKDGTWKGQSPLRALMDRIAPEMEAMGMGMMKEFSLAVVGLSGVAAAAHTIANVVHTDLSFLSSPLPGHAPTIPGIGLGK